MALAIVPHDGPSKWLLNYLEKNKVLPPEDWFGVRDIDRKADPPSLDFRDRDDDDVDQDDDEPDVIGQGSTEAKDAEQTEKDKSKNDNKGTKQKGR